MLFSYYNSFNANTARILSVLCVAASTFTYRIFDEVFQRNLDELQVQVQ